MTGAPGWAWAVALGQHRVLLAGVAGALVLRGGFIAAGAAVLSHLSWAFYTGRIHA